MDGRKVVVGGLTSSYVLSYRRYLATLDDQERTVVRYPKKETAEQSRHRAPDKHTPDISWLADFCEAPGDFHLVLSHHPEAWPLIRDYPFDLCLSAHAHGGQWRVFSHGVWCPGQGLWPKYTKGVYEGRLVVSAGLANTARVPRICNPTEVVFIESP